MQVSPISFCLCLCLSLSLSLSLSELFMQYPELPNSVESLIINFFIIKNKPLKEIDNIEKLLITGSKLGWQPVILSRNYSA